MWTKWRKECHRLRGAGRDGATPPALSDLRDVADYLRPAAYVVLDQLPLSVEGEVELRGLLKAEVKTVTDEYVAPQSPLEIILRKYGWMFWK